MPEQDLICRKAKLRKRSFKNLDGTVTLVSDNKDKARYPDQIIDRKTFNNFNLFGRVRYTFTKL